MIFSYLDHMSKIQSIPRRYSHVQKTPIVIDYAVCRVISTAESKSFLYFSIDNFMIFFSLFSWIKINWSQDSFLSWGSTLWICFSASKKDYTKLLKNIQFRYECLRKIEAIVGNVLAFQSGAQRRMVIKFSWPCPFKLIWWRSDIPAYVSL